MLNLAQLVLSAVAHGAGIEVRIIQGVGFKLISESAHEEKLAEVAKVLSLVGSCTVFYSSSDGTTMQQCDPLGVPVYVAHVPAYVGVRRAIAHELFKILAQPVDRGLEAGASFNLSGSLKEQLSRLCSWELATRESGLPELVIKRDFSLLANDEFLGIIKELHGAGAAFLLRFDPGFEALCLATHEVIGAKAAWKLERKDKVFLLTVYRTPDLDERYIAAAVECLVARVGANIAVQYAIPDGLTCIAPTATETGTPPKCTPTTYLKCSMSAAVPNSNIVTCTIPFETRDSESLKFISDHIAPGSAFVKIVPQRPPGLMSHSQYCEALEHLAARLGIPRLRHRVNQAGKNLVSVAPLATIPDLGSLVTCMAYGKTLASVSASKSEISHPMTRAEMFTFFARTVGHECEWDVKVHADSVAVHTTRPELFSKSIKRMFGVIFGRPLTVVREPEEIQGEYLLSPAQARARTAANQFFPAEFDRILPRGFGEAPIVRQHGNRIIVYSTTENLPRAYIDSVVPDLYGISTPVIIRRDMLASRVKDAATLSDIVVRSLPVGTYLRKIVETEDTFVLELSNVALEF
jgi:hypothetical protein